MLEVKPVRAGTGRLAGAWPRTGSSLLPQETPPWISGTGHGNHPWISCKGTREPSLDIRYRYTGTIPGYQIQIQDPIRGYEVQLQETPP
jgi:hypothetical protein